MKSILCIQKLTLALFICLSLVSLGVQSQAANLNDDVKKLDDKRYCQLNVLRPKGDALAEGGHRLLCTHRFLPNLERLST
jgi:hypothetical protein